VDDTPAPEDDPIEELFREKTGHLTDRHAGFFKKWERLLSLEEQDTTRLRAQLWTMTAKAREKAGRCFSDMVLSSEANETETGKPVSKIHKWTYTFVRAATDTAPASLLAGHISSGDPVQISLEPDLLCLSRGFVTQLTDSSVTVGVGAPLEAEQLLRRTRSAARAPYTFRIDKDELSSGMARMRGNLAHLFLRDGDERRRRLVVDLEKPEFDRRLRAEPHEISSLLNEDQRAAMDKVLTARDYALILGMPGTGKTTTIAEIIRVLVERGKSVLLTSYTHSAVDTIVLKLLNAEFKVLRIGNQDKVGL
jgi:DNA replication ATP-dependent helicase Dna2